MCMRNSYVQLTSDISQLLSGVGSFFCWPTHFSEVIRLNLLARLAQSTAISSAPIYSEGAEIGG